MDNIKAGYVVICEFSFADESGKKQRPTLVIACPEGENFIGCMITRVGFPGSIPITKDSFVRGGLRAEPSFVLPLRIASTARGLVVRVAGIIHRPILNQTIAIIQSALGR